MCHLREILFLYFQKEKPTLMCANKVSGENSSLSRFYWSSLSMVMKIPSVFECIWFTIGQTLSFPSEVDNLVLCEIRIGHTLSSPTGRLVLFELYTVNVQWFDISRAWLESDSTCMLMTPGLMKRPSEYILVVDKACNFLKRDPTVINSLTHTNRVNVYSSIQLRTSAFRVCFHYFFIYIPNFLSTFFMYIQK